VRVEGNEVVSDAAIFGSIHSRAEAVFSEETVSEDARRIILMPQILDVKWRVAPVGDQVDVIFTVVEAEQIASVAIMGNKKIKTEKLMEELQISENDFLDPYLINMGRESLLQVYQEKGYYFATVELDRKVLDSDRMVVYRIVEGPRLRIKKVKFVDNDSIKERKLKKQIKSRAYFPIFRKGRLDDDQLEQDRLAVEGYYHDEGFLDARAIVDTEFNEKRTRVYLTFTVEEGPQYRVGEIRFSGNEKYTEGELREALKLEEGDVLTHKRRVFAQRALTRLYGKEGYIYVNVMLRPQYTEQEGEVNVVFEIEEHGQYKLGRVVIRGNYQTQDKVARRAFDYFDFLPGTLYNTDAVDRAKERLVKGTGLFEEVIVTPTGDSPDERDAQVKVTEGRTGLMLFGVGVDTNSGVLGMFSIEQRNFDASRPPGSLGEFFRGESFVGGGQRLRFDFEPGTELTRGRIKFFEPYLFDQPYYLDSNLFIFRRWRE